MTRDNFSQKTKTILASRVAWRCSYPFCQVVTIGPSNNHEKRSVNVGRAAHITAASPGGPRYNPLLTPEERSSEKNGIWMCQIHADLIDKEHSRCSISDILAWKDSAESIARRNLEYPSTPITHCSNYDLELLNKYCNLFDFKYIQALKNEQFGSRVPAYLIENIIKLINSHDNPYLQFQNSILQVKYNQMYDSAYLFERHFVRHSSGGHPYYKYIDLSSTAPKYKEHFKNEIDKSQILAHSFAEKALDLHITHINFIRQIQ